MRSPFIYCWEYTKLGLHSGEGIVAVCPGYSVFEDTNAKIHGRNGFGNQTSEILGVWTLWKY